MFYKLVSMNNKETNISGECAVYVHRQGTKADKVLIR